MLTTDAKDRVLDEVAYMVLADMLKYFSEPINTSEPEFADKPIDQPDRWTDEAVKAVQPIVNQWLGTIEDEIRRIAAQDGDDSAKFSELQQALVTLYPQLNSADYAETLAEAMLAAELVGRYEVLNGVPPEFEEVDFAALGSSIGKAKVKNCKTGYSCGYGCISRNKICRNPLEGQAANYQDWLEQQSASRWKAGLIDEDYKREVSDFLKDPYTQELLRDYDSNIRQEQYNAEQQAMVDWLRENGALNPVIPDKDVNALNEIVGFDLRKKPDVEKMIQDELDKLTLMGLSFDIERKGREEDAKRRNIMRKTDEFLEEARRSAIDKLNRIYRERISMDAAKLAALNKRIFETLHPRKLIRVPKGTTQMQYAEIVRELGSGNKEYMKKYTVPRPAKKRKRKGNTNFEEMTLEAILDEIFGVE